ncbi:Phytanoyl-CoA dioxygenase (PhyH) [Paenibacillus sp. UNCCL117]|uniref:phytanoyl-CoA dioxygenase family protein n=1 Tax=unclassified Paenibacillus TaxID=185978 RepID=UPI0008852556|nr:MULTISPECIES: phytanoyl-CoA dioxygenase family protein [unclassified Paenibacillus]SDC93671.1 Phytanoyl-CoA dioxygenase (PhyH) [Paenibacillus sp. cl123]SFW29612.1 Phytanoyl-CoA dioxygenase (PhyH) [Paenibacillus sp. UNCCL117]
MITKGSLFSAAQFQEEGYSGPVQGLTLEEADNYYRLFFDTLGQSRFEPGPARISLSAWHHRHRWAYELATHPSIVGAMRQILGEDLVLWAMQFWYKEPNNDKFIPWHQDINYWPMEPAINASAWVSLGWSIRENGCLRVIPGTHRSVVEHISTGDAQSMFSEGLPGELVDESQAIDLEMSPGQMAFFNEAIFHGSEINSSNIPRVAFSVRYTTPEVRFLMDEWGGDTSRIRTFLVHGEDTLKRNESIRGVVPEE